jgi:hypothetical protein
MLRSAADRAAAYGYFGYTVARRSARRLRSAGVERTRSQRRYGLCSDALVLHCPGPMRMAPNPFRHVWSRACRRFFADETLHGRFADADDLSIITYSTYDTEILLERCLRTLGLRAPVVLGRGVERWEWLHKVALVAEHLERAETTTEYVMCLDGDDVLVIGDPAVALGRFLEMGCEMLFCGTRGDQPPSPECRRFEDAVGGADPRHRHLNAGAYIGRTEFVRERLREILAAHAAGEPWCFSAEGFDDQLAWRHMHMRHHPDIRIDADCRVFLRFDEDR